MLDAGRVTENVHRNPECCECQHCECASCDVAQESDAGLEELIRTAQGLGLMSSTRRLTLRSCTCFSLIKVYTGHTSSCPVWRYHTGGPSTQRRVLTEIIKTRQAMLRKGGR